MCSRTGASRRGSGIPRSKDESAAHASDDLGVSLRITAALGALVAFLAVGCGGAGTSSSGVTGAPISFEQLAQSAATSADASSGRFSFEMSLAFPGGDESFSLSGEGAFDRASQRASFAVDMSSFAKLLGGLVSGLGGDRLEGAPDFDDPAGWQLEVVQDGDVGYMRFPALDDKLPEGKTWIRAEKGDAASGFQLDEFEQFAQSDPRDLLEALRAVSSEVKVVGTESLRGVETTHYRAVIDPADLAARAPKDQQEQAQTLLDQLTSQTGLVAIPVDVWIDASGLVRKLSMSLSAEAQDGNVELAFEIWDYNEPVTIELPPASQVVDASAIRD